MESNKSGQKVPSDRVRTESKILSKGSHKKIARLNVGDESLKEGLEKYASGTYAKTKQSAARSASKAAEGTAKEATEKLMRMGKIGTAVGIGAAIISGLNKNNGRQSNSQLYGQKGY